MKIPENYQTVMPYLIVNNAEAFIAFTKDVFGATEKMRDMRDEKIIRHAEIMIGDSTIMLADSIPDYPPSTAGMFVYVEDVDTTYKKAVERGAKTLEGISDKDYGRTCGVEDPFGNVWWVTQPK